MRNIVISVLVFVAILALLGMVSEAQTRRPFSAYQSGGNCVYVAEMGYPRGLLTVTPKPVGGC